MDSDQSVLHVGVSSATFVAFFQSEEEEEMPPEAKLKMRNIGK